MAVRPVASHASTAAGSGSRAAVKAARLRAQLKQGLMGLPGYQGDLLELSQVDPRLLRGLGYDALAGQELVPLEDILMRKAADQAAMREYQQIGYERPGDPDANMGIETGNQRRAALVRDLSQERGWDYGNPGSWHEPGIQELADYAPQQLEPRLERLRTVKQGIDMYGLTPQEIFPVEPVPIPGPKPPGAYGGDRYGMSEMITSDKFGSPIPYHGPNEGMWDEIDEVGRYAPDFGDDAARAAAEARGASKQRNLWRLLKQLTQRIR